MRDLYSLASGLVVLAYTKVQRRRFAAWGQGSRLHPPARLYNPGAIGVGKGVTILEHAWLNAKPREDGSPSLLIGDGTYIGRFVHVNAIREVTLEAGVMVADRVFLGDEEHLFSDRSRPILEQGTRFKGPVTLCTGCWIGEGACILPGVTVGRNAVVGANAVVTRSVPDFTVVVGIPARAVSPTVRVDEIVST